MAKIPDFGGLTKKLDIQSLMDTVKSAVSGTGGAPPKPPEGDEVAARFVEVITLMQNLSTQQSEQAKAISTIHTKLNALYKDMQALRGANATTGVSGANATTEEKTPPTDSPDNKNPE